MANSSSKSSTWGSFLQQAVAGVEARLDTILADEQCKTAKEATKSSQPQGTHNLTFCSITCNFFCLTLLILVLILERIFDTSVTCNVHQLNFLCTNHSC